MLPCPFCGMRPDLQPWSSGYTHKVMVSCENDACLVQPAVSGRTALQAAAAWNVRAPQGEWLPIETAPTDKTLLLLGCNSGDPANGVHIVIGSKLNDCWVDRAADDGNRDLGNRMAFVTHWLPFPATPSGDKK